MARYFFNLKNDLDVPDEEGEDLPDLAAAQERARAYALDMSAASVLERGTINLHHRIDVSDESGATVHSVEFGDVVLIDR
jgi:hypothetical protein